MSCYKLKIHYFFVLFFGGFIVFLINASDVHAISVGVSPPKLMFRDENSSQSFVIFNPNNETLQFSVKSSDDYLRFSTNSGKLKPMSSVKIKAEVSRVKELFQGTYEDIVLISVYKDNSNAFKSSAAIKTLLNITQNISMVDYYYDNTSLKFDDYISNRSIAESTGRSSLLGKITGFSVFDSSLKGNVWVGLGLVALLIVLLYLFVKEG
jgi:hypothetical protein